jgi:hypothetical protein
MPSVDLPFWIVAEQHHILYPPAHEPCDEANTAHCFTAAEKLTAYMTARGGARWSIDQVADREGVIVLVSGLYERGINSICIDPEPDGSGGLLVSLSDLLAAYGK